MARPRIVRITTVCPACNTAGPVRLTPGQVCAACEAQDAWQRAGERVVIDHDSIAAAVRRREGEAAGEPLWRRGLVWVMPAATLGAAGLAVWWLWGLLSARSIGPLAALVADLTASARNATLIGLASAVLGVVALVRLRRRRQFRRLVILACHLLAIMAGGSALVIGGLHWLGAGAGGNGWQHNSMPARGALAVPGHVQRVLDATVVVLATDADGDARSLAMGTGAVIARDEHRAWVVTCSHVAMPYVAVGTWRHSRDAAPVWVQLSDGREGRGAVRWTAPPPLDIVLIELPIDHPPEPVVIAADTTALGPDDQVTFVPNPYRNGWEVLHGKLLRRDSHRTPAGTYDLLFTDLPVIPGDSGSGLYDARGQLVGLNTWTHFEDGRALGISLPSETMQVLVSAIYRGKLDQLDEAVAAPPRSPRQ
jgi:S1-C subfamily serine protease